MAVSQGRPASCRQCAVTRHAAWFVVLFLFARPAAGGTTPAWQGKVDARVLQKAEAGECEFLVFLSEQADVRDAAAFKVKQAKGAHVFSRLHEVAQRTQAPVLDLLRARGLAHRSFWLANMLWVRGDSAAVQVLGQRDDVLRILDNPSMHLQEPALSPEAVSGTIEWNIVKVRAPDVWALGYTGQGVVIGGQDTGYQWSHAALVGHYRGWDGTNADHNYSWHDAIHTNDSHYGSANPYGYDTRAPCDDNSHGTHTMGTMVGDDGLGNQIGICLLYTSDAADE